MLFSICIHHEKMIDAFHNVDFITERATLQIGITQPRWLSQGQNMIQSNVYNLVLLLPTDANSLLCCPCLSDMPCRTYYKVGFRETLNKIISSCCSAEWNVDLFVVTLIRSAVEKISDNKEVLRQDAFAPGSST